MQNHSLLVIAVPGSFSDTPGLPSPIWLPVIKRYCHYLPDLRCVYVNRDDLWVNIDNMLADEQQLTAILTSNPNLLP
ncbi:MAG: hypothetical protein IM631_13280 [Cytophagales bacterium]|jgi:hypothetical protein|nr:hypothetical protein [Cytophagales bacterium]MCA6382492.1 hypothetical protein [Cytophagales bacterium]